MLLFMRSQFSSWQTLLGRLEFPRETGLILRCAGKAGNPFQTTQGLILCCPLLLLPLVFPTIRIFSSESALHIARRTLVTPMTRLCIWPSGLGWGLGGSVGGSRTASAGPEDRDQSWAPSGPLLQVLGPHTRSPSLPLGRASKHKVTLRGLPASPLPQGQWIWGLLPAVEGEDGGHRSLGSGMQAWHGAWRPQYHPALVPREKTPTGAAARGNP